MPRTARLEIYIPAPWRAPAFKPASPYPRTGVDATAVAQCRARFNALLFEPGRPVSLHPAPLHRLLLNLLTPGARLGVTLLIAAVLL